MRALLLGVGHGLFLAPRHGSHPGGGGGPENGLE